MLFRTRRCCFQHLVRTVDGRGFVGNFRRLNHTRAVTTQKRAAAAVREKQNVIFCGHYGTGKLNVLRAIGEHCESQLGLRVAYVSASSQRANRLDGFLLHHFIGLRVSRDELPSQEQLEGTLERHVRLVDSTFEGCVPSLQNADVLILDSIEKIDPVVLRAMDAVARRQREKPNMPFGGLRVFGAADFWSLPVHPHSDVGGYAFQLSEWPELFPSQVLLTKTFGQSQELHDFTEKALFGTLTLPEMQSLEALSRQGKSAAQQLIDDDDGDDDMDTDVGSRRNQRQRSGKTRSPPIKTKLTKPKGGSALSSLPSMLSSQMFDDVQSNADAIICFTPRFPKQPCIKVLPTKYRLLKQVEVGNFLVNMLLQSSLPMSYGLVDNLSLEEGSRVHLLMDGQEEYGVAAGAVGEVLRTSPHRITVHFLQAQRTVDIPRMRVTVHHPSYPEVQYQLEQFPLFPRERLCPMQMLHYGHAYGVNLNCRRLADTNDLGNILAHMRSFEDFTVRNVRDFAHLEGMVHEPTRIYYHQVLGRPLSASGAKEQWCRNCKTFVPTDAFFSHWAACVQSVRWCAECSRTVPLSVLEPHKEKHQIVMCMDCGQAVEWRHWEAHRLSCGPMMREVSADNEFLPLRTRQLALELGLDKRDLHTMKTFSRSMLPKSREQVH